MSNKTDTIEKKNITLTIGQLQQDATTAALEVTESFRLRDEALAVRDEALVEIAEGHKERHKEKNKFRLKKEEMDADTLLYKREVKIRLEKLKDLTDTEKTLVKKLDKLNTYIFDAEAEIVDLDKGISVLNDKITQGVTLDKQTAALVKEIVSLEKLKVVEEKDIAKKRKKYSSHLSKLQKTLDSMENTYRGIEKSTQESEKKKRDFDNEYDRKMKTMRILIKRFKKSYPNITFKL